MFTSDPEIDNIPGSGWERCKVCGGDNVDVDGGKYRGGG